MRDMPVRIVADGVLTRSVRDTAAFFREAEKVYRALHAAAGRGRHPSGPGPAPGRGRDRGGPDRRVARGRRADA